MAISTFSNVKERGVALVSVLLITSAIAALVYHVVTRHTFAVAFTQQHTASAQLREFALGGETIARQSLLDDLRDEAGSRADTLLENWAQSRVIEDEDIKIYIKIIDLQSYFNLNSLVGESEETAHSHLERIALELDLDIALPDLWLDWIDENELTSPMGAEDLVYLAHNPPFRTPNTLAADVSEVRVVIPLSNEQYEKLTKYVTVLPDPDTLMNINTVDALTLRTMDESISDSLTMALVSSDRKFDSVETAITQYPALNAVSDRVTVRSSYFAVAVKVESEFGKKTLVSTMMKDYDANQVRVIARDYSQLIPKSILLTD